MIVVMWSLTDKGHRLMLEYGRSTDLGRKLLMEKTMPSTSKKQAKFMRAAAKNKKFAAKAKIKQSVARDFHNADKKRGK